MKVRCVVYSRDDQHKGSIDVSKMVKHQMCTQLARKIEESVHTKISHAPFGEYEHALEATILSAAGADEVVRLLRVLESHLVANTIASSICSTIVDIIRCGGLDNLDKEN